MENKKYSLYLASGITLWKEYFHKRYSKYFNHRLRLFEPAVLSVPDDHRKIPIGIACFDLNEVNHSDALLVYMKYYKTLDGSPAGTDSTWECGYAIAHGKPVIMLIEDTAHVDYYAAQWMVAFSINAVLTADPKVVETIKDHPKFVHTAILFADSSNQFEYKIISYLEDYYRSIYSRSGKINFDVDRRARELFSKKQLEQMLAVGAKPHQLVVKECKKLLKYRVIDTDHEYLAVCAVERSISRVLEGNCAEETLDLAIAGVLQVWGVTTEHAVECLIHSIKAPFAEVRGHKHGVKKTRPELFYELYDLVTHHLVSKQRWIKSPTFPYDMGAVIEFYNWVNTYSIDDVFDNSKFRQGEETVWRRFTRRDAILTGILGHILALKYCYVITQERPDLAKRFAEILNRYNHLIYQGQVLDIALTFDQKKKKKLFSIKNFQYLSRIYLKRIYGICGGFYEAIGELSAKAGNKEEQILNGREIDVISLRIGYFYGMIQMMRNDLADYLVIERFSSLSKGMKGVSHTDIIEGKTDLAYLIAVYSSHLTNSERRFLIDVLHTHLSQRDKLTSNELLWRSGAIDCVIDVISRLIKHVKVNLLTVYHETPTRMKWLFSMVEITHEVIRPFEEQARKYGWMKHQFDSRLSKSITCELIRLSLKPRHHRINSLPNIQKLLH